MCLFRRFGMCSNHKMLTVPLGPRAEPTTKRTGPLLRSQFETKSFGSQKLRSYIYIYMYNYTYIQIYKTYMYVYHIILYYIMLYQNYIIWYEMIWYYIILHYIISYSWRSQIWCTNLGPPIWVSSPSHRIHTSWKNQNLHTLRAFRISLQSGARVKTSLELI